jgi:iron(III) transport system permease protein
MTPTLAPPVDVTPSQAAPMQRRSATQRRLEAGGQSLVWLAVVVLAAAPVLPLLYASFRSQPYYLPGGTWTVHAYASLLSNGAFRSAVVNTLVYGACTAGLAVAAGTLLAVLAHRTDMPGRRWLGPSLLAPLAVPPLGLIVGWVAIYGPPGYLTDLVHHNLGLPGWDLYTLTGMVLFGTTIATPITYLIARASLSSSNSQLEEAARASGAGPARILRSVTLPMLRPAIANAFILVLALSVEVLGVPLILGGPKNINFVASYLYTSWNTSSTPNPAFVSAGGVLVLVAVSLLLVLRRRLLGAEERFVASDSRGAGSDVRPIELGPWRWAAAAATAGFVTLTTIIPVLGLGLMSSVKALTTLIAPWHLLTGANWSQVANEPALQRSIVDSLLIAAVGGAATVMVVAVAAVLAHRSKFRLRGSLPPMLVYARSVPGTILGIGFFWAFLMLGSFGSALRTTIWGEMFALCARNVALAYMVIYPALTRLSPDLDRAGRAVGASWWTTTRRIVLPNLRIAIAAAFVLMFIVLLSDYDPVVFLQKPGTEILGVTMLQQWQVGVVGPVAALAVLQLGIVVAALGSGALVLRRLRVAGRPS